MVAVGHAESAVLQRCRRMRCSAADVPHALPAVAPARSKYATLARPVAGTGLLETRPFQPRVDLHVL